MGFKNGKSGKAFGDDMRARARKVQEETKLIAKAAVRSVEAEFRKRDLMVKRVNKQDRPGGKAVTPSQGRRRRRSPGEPKGSELQRGLQGVADNIAAQSLSRRKNATVRDSTTSQGAVIKLQVQAFWTGARSRAIKGVLTYLGLIPMLFRTSLVVKTKLRNAGPIYQRRISFRQNRRLAAWATREDRGSQYLRHVIYAKGEIINSLVMKPTLKAVVPTVLNSWEKATLTALRGFR